MFPRSALSCLLVAILAATLRPSVATAGGIGADPQNPAWLFRDDGSPLFLCGPGDPEGFLYRGTENPDGTRSGDQDAIVQKLVGTGANCIQMMAVRSHGGDGGPTENPFVNHDENEGLNPAVLAQWDGWLGALDAAGVVVDFIFYDDGTLVWDTGPVVGPEEEAFLQALVDRYEHLDHLIWCVAEEYQEAIDPARVSAIAAVVAAHDDFDHPITVHQLAGPQFHFPTDPNLDSFSMQINDTIVPSEIHQRVLDAWALADGRYNVNCSEVRFHWDNRDDSRKRCWAAALAGAYVMVHRMDVATTPVEALEDCGRLASFLESVDFHLMSPRDSLARAETEYVFGDPSAGYVLYSAAVSDSLGLAIPAGGAGLFDLRWLDTVTGAAVLQTDFALAEGDHVWEKPASLGSEIALAVQPTVTSGAGVALEVTSWGRLKDRYRTGRE